MDMLLNILSFVCLSFFVSVDCLMFHLPVNHQKCLKEEIHKDILVTGLYDISETSGPQKVDLKVYFQNIELPLNKSY